MSDIGCSILGAGAHAGDDRDLVGRWEGGHVYRAYAKLKI